MSDYIIIQDKDYISNYEVLCKKNPDKPGFYTTWAFRREGETHWRGHPHNTDVVKSTNSHDITTEEATAIILNRK